MNSILIFIIATIINVTLCTVRALCTIKGGKWLSATMNAICYGFYPLIVMLTAKGTVDIIANMIITAVVNFVFVWLIKFIEEKARKDKMWKVEIAIPFMKADLVEDNFINNKISYNFNRLGKWVIFNCYCETQKDTHQVVEITKQFNGKYSAYESKISI